MRSAPHCAALSGGQGGLLYFAVIVPAGARHNVINTGSQPLKLYTIYAPPEHRDGVVHKDKAQAEREHDSDHWDGGTTE